MAGLPVAGLPVTERMGNCTFRMAKDLKKMITDRARKTKTTPSDYIRLALGHFSGLSAMQYEKVRTRWEALHREIAALSGSIVRHLDEIETLEMENAKLDDYVRELRTETKEKRDNVQAALVAEV